MMDIEQYLRENKPELPDEGQFLIETNARLNNVEGIRRCVQTEHHRGRAALTFALIGGFIFGCLATAFITLFPAPRIGFDSSTFYKIVAVLQEWRDYFIALIAVCAIALGVVFISRRKEAI